MANWLVKSEPDVYSIDLFAKEKRTLWDGVRNYQARNFLKAMKPGDQVLFYHSSCEDVGVVGVAEVSKTAVPDPLQFDRSSDYFDETASKDAPRWFSPELKFSRRFPSVVSLATLKRDKRLSAMKLLEKGSRLSVQPVTTEEFEAILEIADK